MPQLSIAVLNNQNDKKRTEREVFRAEMDAVVPWALFFGRPVDASISRGTFLFLVHVTFCRRTPRNLVGGSGCPSSP
jgi:hypothetical protein